MNLSTFLIRQVVKLYCEKVSTPTSVILMAINAGVGFFLHQYIIGDFVEPVLNYWLAAIPVVVVGAPVGAMLCSLLKRQTIVMVILGLTFVELVSSFLLIPLTLPVISSGICAFIIFSSIYYLMYRTRVTALENPLTEPNYRLKITMEDDK